MLKHRGFPSRLAGTDHHFTIRRPAKGNPTRLVARERYADRRREDLAADEAFLAALWAAFGDAPFERGNLDAGRLSWVLGREVLPADDPFDPESYDARLRLDPDAISESFPNALEDPDP